MYAISKAITARPSTIILHVLQDILTKKSQNIEHVNSEQAIIRHSLVVEGQLPSREIQRFGDEYRLRECALHSGVGVIHNVSFNLWDFMKLRLSAMDYKVIPNIYLYSETPDPFLP